MLKQLKKSDFYYLEKMLPVMLLLIACCGAAQGQNAKDTIDIFSLLPANGTVKGWVTKEVPMHYAGEDLFYLIDGGADIYLEYGFNQVVAARYSNGITSIQVEIYDMADPNGAFGVYSNNSSGHGEDIALGNESVVADYYLMFWKDHYFIMLTANNQKSNTSEGLVALASAIDKKIPEKGDKPPLLDLLEGQPMIPVDVNYLRGNLALENIYHFDAKDIFHFSEGLAADYGDYKIFILKYPTANKANKTYLQARDTIKQNPKFSNYLVYPEGFSVTDKQKENILCLPYKTYILIVMQMGKMPENEIMNIVKQNIDVVNNKSDSTK